MVGLKQPEKGPGGGGSLSNLEKRERRDQGEEAH